MFSRGCLFCLAAALAVVPGSRGQTSSPHAPADYSQEASVVEELSTKVAFDNDGNLTREQTSRIRVQTDAGVQQWGLLNFPFQSATQTVDIDYVRVRKPDGSTVATPPDNIQDLDSEITRSAPFYSDLREKHVAVKGLGKGDILEYGAHWHATKPLVPGQFWFQYNFHQEGIVLGERLEIRVPVGRAVKFKGPQATRTVTTEGDSRIYTWTYAKLDKARAPESDKKKIDAALGRLPAPDVQISSFQSWEAVGRWYWNLQKDRSEPTAVIRAKAAELTKGMTDDAAKLHALYSFVSTQYRYIGIAFGIGRYQPHAAEDVLTNNYGDCKDKHTLLASLLQASGIPLYPALISSGRMLDPDVPSPAQFDHIIGFLLQGKSQAWLDTTPEIAPSGYLVPPLRDKPALVIFGDHSARLVTTPADPPYPSTQTFKIDSKLSDSGTLEAKVEDTSRGDGEVALRSAFRRIPQSEWKDLVQQISYTLGYAGTVSDVSASAPEKISEPFHFSYSYNRKDYPDWSNHQITVPGLPFYMPPVKDDATEPVWLGPPLETVSDSRVELPKAYKPQLPSNVDLKYDFAEYHASYSQDQNVLVAKRLLLVKTHAVPVTELDDYRSFLKNLQNDLNRYVQTSSASEPAIPNSSPPGTFPSLLSSIQSLPESNSAEANGLEADARTAIRAGDRSGALSALQRVVEADKKFTRAWLELATVYMASAQVDSALDALRTAIDSDPKQLLCRKTYAIALTTLRRPEAALNAWRDVVKIAPEDPDANAALGTMLIQQKRYSEAVPYMETAAQKDRSAAAQSRLGSAYLRAGQIEKGTSTLQKILEADSTPVMLNDVAYEMADTNANLAKALEYAQQAVEKQEKESHDLELANLLPEDLACTRKIGMFWDTLGWVHFRLGHLDQAESYLRAAWLLSQTAVIGDHLGHVYEQQKKTNKAIHTYRLVLATPEAHGTGAAWDETRRRLNYLTGGKAPTAMEMRHGDASGNELGQLRSVKLKRIVPGSATAEFFLLFSPASKAPEVQFISGSEKLRSADAALTEASFQIAFPQGSSARLVRRAILMCSSVVGCNAVLLTPDSVNSVK